MATSSSSETYTHGYGDNSTAFLQGRKADTHGAFLLPHLRKGMHLLDCGC